MGTTPLADKARTRELERLRAGGDGPDGTLLARGTDIFERTSGRVRRVWVAEARSPAMARILTDAVNAERIPLP